MARARAGSFIFVALFLRASAQFDPYDTSTPEDTASLLQMYANHVNSSLELDKSDRRIMKGWATDFQVQQINVTTHYRLQMMRHKEHSYNWINGSVKWHECIQIHRKDMQHSEQNYYAAESHCLKSTNANEGKKRHAVYQVEREIKKWRKSYRYLLNKCKSNNPGGHRDWRMPSRLCKKRQLPCYIPKTHPIETGSHVRSVQRDEEIPA